MKITTTQSGVRAEYCVSEFCKYIGLVTDGKIVPETELGVAPALEGKDTIRLGLLEDFNLNTDDLKDPFVEDIIDINIENGEGYIAGSNERSILMGVYRYFHSAGCRFLRPGTDGEYIPKWDMSKHSFKYRKKADKIFRGECCEGAISYEHMRDTVYWMPKVGMNMYMIEGVVPYTYMHKWYAHIGNEKLHEKGYVTDHKMLSEKIALLEQDIVKTGIQFHNLGHAWMFRKFNVKDYGPGQEHTLPDEIIPYLAQVNGKRGLFSGSCFYTHFCYSNPEARKILVDTLVDYMKDKPYVDFVHAWLADAPNNSCECDECQKMTPSDWYVVFLNELDEALTKIGSQSRIVMILYVETVRPALIEKIKNPKRFIMLAALGSGYQERYQDSEYDGEVPPFKVNNYGYSLALKFHWYKQWREQYPEMPSMIFEYRFYKDHYDDPGYMQVSQEVFYDMSKGLDDLKLDGNMSDQTHRMHLPTSLPMLLMGEAQFNTSLDYEEFTNDYFMSAFGEDGLKCRKYLETLSDLFCVHNIRVSNKCSAEDQGIQVDASGYTTWKNNPEVYEKVSKISGVVKDFLPVIEKNLNDEDKCRARSWFLLKHHAHIADKLSRAYALGASGKLEEGAKLFLELEKDIAEFEMDIHDDFDLFLFSTAIRTSKFNLPFFKYYD